MSLLWQSYSYEKYPNAVSIPKLVEKNADDLKNQYLKLIYDLGEKKLNKRTITNQLQLRTGFNYWWLTLIVEKCNYTKSTWINDAIRFLAFEGLINKQNIKKLKLVSANVQLSICFRAWCEERGIEFRWERLPSAKVSKTIIKRFYGFLPLPFQALLWLVFHIVSRWPLRGSGLEEWKSTKGRITFVSYLFNLVPESVESGIFESPFWAHLPDSLHKDGIATNWLHIYVKDRVLPSAIEAAKLVYTFNQTGRGNQVHATLDSFLGLRAVIKSLLDWKRLIKVGRKLEKMTSLDIGHGINLWPLMQMDLKESFYGRTALNNLLDFNLFEEALGSLPKQKKGVYLQENQGWEFGLIQAWNRLGHDVLIGVPHATVRFWDLRYFFDSRSYNVDISNQLPRPTMVAVNGKLAQNNYIQGGYPKNELVDVEALRYLHLKTIIEKSDPIPNNNRFIRVLVLGEYLSENTCYQMRILEEAYPSFSNYVKLIIKPHPNSPIKAADYPALDMKLAKEPLQKLLINCDVAFTSEVTSVALDAYCYGIPVISSLNPKTLNMSPLRGFKGIEFITTADELVRAIKNIKLNIRQMVEQEKFFFLDPELPKWEKLLFS